MKISIMGTAAYERVPSTFCTCPACNLARRKKGKNMRTQAQALINDDLLVDLGEDTYLHYLRSGRDFTKIENVLITHPHSDHLLADELVKNRPPYGHNNMPPIGLYGDDETYEKYLQTELGNVNFTRVAPYDTFNVGKYTVTALPADHGTICPMCYIISDGDDLCINYGLFTRHENRFGRDKIRCVKVSQGLIKRIFGFATLHIEVIGYLASSSDDENGQDNEIGVLVPFCRIDEVDGILKAVLPDYVPDAKQGGAKALFPFLSWFLLIYVISTVAVFGIEVALMLRFGASDAVFRSVIFGTAIACATILALAVVNAALRYGNESVSVGGDKITVYSGGFTRTVSVFRAKDLIAVESETTPMRKKAGIKSYTLHIRTNSATNEIKVEMQNEDIESLLFDKLVL